VPDLVRVTIGGYAGTGTQDINAMLYIDREGHITRMHALILGLYRVTGVTATPGTSHTRRHPVPHHLGMTTLTLKAMGINDLLNFDFMDPPPVR